MRHSRPSHQLSNSFWNERWTLKDAVAPWEWFTQAVALKESADLVWCQHLEEMILLHTDMFAMQPRPVSNIYGMLAGLSLEVLLKVMWLSQHPGSVSRASHTIHLPWRDGHQLDGHDLLALTQLVGRECSPMEKDVLDKLSVCVCWAGRYPMANKPEEEVLVASHTREERQDWFPGSISQPDRTVFEALFDELSGRYLRDADMQIDGLPFRELLTVKDRVTDAEGRLHRVVAATFGTDVEPPSTGNNC